MREPSDQQHEFWFGGRPASGLSARLAKLSSSMHLPSTAPRSNGLTDASAKQQPEPAGYDASVSDMHLGERVAQARHEARLTSKQLAERVGLSLWKTEQLEAGRGDVAAYVPAVAAATAKPVDWFLGPDAGRSPAEIMQPQAGRQAPSHAPASPPLATGGSAPSLAGANLVLGCLVVLVVVRFFTEVVAVLPRFANFVDIPIFIAIVAAALVRSVPAERPSRLMPMLLLCFGFVVMCTIAMITNLSRVDLAPALVFVYGFLGPIGLFFAVYHLWPAGAALRLSRVLVALCVLQIVIAFGVDLPMFLASGDPDVISGTFGENAYQLVFFLLVVAGLLAGMFTFEKRRLAARLAPLLLIAILAVIFLAQYRSLLLTTALVVVLIGALLSSVGARGIMIAAMTGAAMLGTLAYVAQNLPGLKFASTIEDARANPTFYLEKRLETLSVIERVFGDTPRFALTGTGPGTYSSRAWRTFALTESDSDSDVAGDYVLRLTQGRPYRTDVSDKYVRPQLRNLEAIGGSFAINRPLASYLSLLAEVGVVGFVLMVGLYILAFVRSTRMTLLSGRLAQPGDPIPGLACASTVAFFVLLQMAALDNWLEVTRITFIAWVVFAVVTKELAARHEAIDP